MEPQHEVFYQDCNGLTARSIYSLLYLTRPLVLLLSASLFSIFISFFTGLSFVHSYSYYFSTFLAYTLDRKYMFLLCNGILVFLAAKSRFCPAAGQDMILDPTPAAAVPEPVSEQEPSTHLQSVSSSVCTLSHATLKAEQEQQGEALDEVESESEGSRDMVGGDDTESDGPASNTEELNRKIEEFIRRMKEELRLEAQQQQLIVA